jgi:hypothetical protein
MLCSEDLPRWQALRSVVFLAGFEIAHELRTFPAPIRLPAFRATVYTMRLIRYAVKADLLPPGLLTTSGATLHPFTVDVIKALASVGTFVPCGDW